MKKTNLNNNNNTPVKKITKKRKTEFKINSKSYTVPNFDGLFIANHGLTVFRKLFKSILPVLTETNMTMDETGIEILSLDVSHVCFIKCFLPKGIFEHYEFVPDPESEDSGIRGVKIDSFLKCLDYLDHDGLCMFYCSGDRFHLESNSVGGKKEVSLRKLEIVSQAIDTEIQFALVFHIVFLMKNPIFELVKTFKCEEADVIEIGITVVEGDGVYVSASVNPDENSCLKNTFKVENNELIETFEIGNVLTESPAGLKFKYSVRYFKYVLECLKFSQHHSITIHENGMTKFEFFYEDERNTAEEEKNESAFIKKIETTSLCFFLAARSDD